MRICIPALFALLAMAPGPKLDGATEELLPVGEVYRFLPGGSWRRTKAADNQPDPVPGLTDEEAAAARQRVRVSTLLRAYVDRIAAAHGDLVDPELQEWLAQREDLRNAFWLALDPRYDDAAGAIAMLDRLRRERPESVERYYHLAIAMAVVHDQADAVDSARYFLIWGVEAEQWRPRPDPMEIWDFFTDPQRNRHLAMRPDRLVWPLLVHVVDLDLDQAERDWAIQRFHKQSRQLQTVYRQVRYDYAKLDRQPSLGKREYSLANLLDPAVGGVCVDQAHVCSRVMKTFGIPALKMAGHGRYGGAGHAWASYLVLRGGAGLADTGRYNGDNYWTGTAFDPQRRTTVRDRDILMMLDGAVQDYPRYIEALALTRMAAASADSHPQAAYELVAEALDRNGFCKPAWEQLADHYLTGTIDDDDLNRHFRRIGYLKRHPDTLVTVIERILQRYATDDIRARMKLYDSALRILGERPDLQLHLTRLRCQELFAAGHAEPAIETAVNVLVANCEEGRLILPLVTMVVEECLQFDAAVRRHAYDYLDAMAERNYPRQRHGVVAESYLELRALLDRLR
ncbi:MAG: hypothetical protein ACOCXJ_00310 [Planctomycetota bacterium]